MAGGSSRNLRLADWVYTFLSREGAKTTQEIKDYINHVEHVYTQHPSKTAKKSFNSYSSHQIAQVVSRSPLFKKVGMATNTYRTQKAKASLWDVVPIEQVVDALENKKHILRKIQPRPIKLEMQRRRNNDK